MLTLLIITVGIIILFSFAAKSPNDLHVERSLQVSASPEQIFPLINDFRAWAEWSPYEKLDPKMNKTFSGSESGPGAVYEWQGSGRAGAGSMEITKVSEPMRVTLILDTVKPLKGHHVVVFNLTPSRSGTIVTWAMDGTIPFFIKVIGQFLDVDKMIGKDFEEGLMNLKAAVEPPLEDEE
jgi:uncharacterized protein YndB with AHSA1/START domain